MAADALLLALNVGSSSLKFQAAAHGAPRTPLLSGAVERVGSKDGATIGVRFADGEKTSETVDATDHRAAIGQVRDVLADRLRDAPVIGVGHRIVHGGGRFSQAVEIDAMVMSQLEALTPLAPLHQPHGLQGVRSAAASFAEARQIACFDTGFHSQKPWLHDAFALPRVLYDEAGLRRYGFHGLSCQSIARTLREERWPIESRRLVIAHLGNGCSMTAVKNGACVANSMGFSTLDGLTMGTRCGRIDPGVLLHLMRTHRSVEEIEALLYQQSGLLGLSGVSNDMRDLAASGRIEAREAIDFFVARAIEEICRMAGALGGLDAIVFCGGIGENAAPIRDAIVDGVRFLPGRDGDGVEILVRATREEEEILLEVASFIS